MSEKRHRAQRHTPYTWSTKLPESWVRTTNSKINKVVNKRSKALSGLVAVGNIFSILYVKYQAVVLQDRMTKFGCQYILHSDLLHFRKHIVFEKLDHDPVQCGLFVKDHNFNAQRKSING